MMRNYLLIALRNLTKNITYSVVNVVGLAVGLAGCLLVTLFISFEVSYDKFHTKSDGLYRYIARRTRDSQVNMQTFLPAGFAPLMKEHFPEVAMYTRFSGLDDKPLLKSGNETIDAKWFAMADPDFFKMFSFDIVQGDEANTIQRPFTIMIAESVARKFFPNGDAIGKTLRYDNTFDFEITGVFKDIPANSHLAFTYLTSFETSARILERRYNHNAQEFLSNLNAWNYSAYFYLPNVTDTDLLAKRMETKFQEAQGETRRPSSMGDWLQPVSEIHFTKGIRGDSANGNLNYIYIFSAVALLILVIASFNFMNLSIARALKRAKEVGLRKVIGATRYQLIGQFLGETLVLITISMVLGVILLELFIPFFNSLMDLPLEINYFGSGGFWPILLAIGLFTALLAGVYPAVYLSSFIPAQVLKGRTGAIGNTRLRKVLTTLQFAAAIFLLIGTSFVFLQMNYIRSTDLGFDDDQIIYFQPAVPIANKLDAFKANLLATAAVKSVTVSNGTPGMESSTYRYSFPGLEIPETSLNTMIIDYDYVNTFGLDIVDGRNLSSEYATDSAASYLVNEAFVKEYFLEKPVGTSIQVLDGHPPAKIVGVVKDFHYRSLHRKIEPLVLRIDPRNVWCMSVKMSSGNLVDKIAAVENEWKKIAPDHVFVYEFLDETIARQYKAEKNASVMLTSFTFLAIVIACVGLLALTSFMTEQRKKEIGIRKVLGSTISSIIMLLSKDFLKLVLIAFVIVVPIAWYVVQQWLQGFEYKIDIDPLIFVLSGFFIAAIAWTSIAYQSFKAARINPSDTLRNE